MEGKNHGYCLINGRVQNLSEVQDLLDSGKRISGEITRIMMNKYGLEPIDAYLFEKLVIEKGIPANYDEILRQRDLRVAQRQLRCPRCGSTYVEKMVYAPLSYIRREYWYCKNCHFEFK